MTKPLNEMSVEELKKRIDDAVLCCHHDFTSHTASEALDELSRRNELMDQRATSLLTAFQNYSGEEPSVSLLHMAMDDMQAALKANRGEV